MFIAVMRCFARTKSVSALLQPHRNLSLKTYPAAVLPTMKISHVLCIAVRTSRFHEDRSESTAAHRLGA